MISKEPFEKMKVEIIKPKKMGTKRCASCGELMMKHKHKYCSDRCSRDVENKKRNEKMNVL